MPDKWGGARRARPPPRSANAIRRRAVGSLRGADSDVTGLRCISGFAQIYSRNDHSIFF